MQRVTHGVKWRRIHESIANLSLAENFARRVSLPSIPTNNDAEKLTDYFVRQRRAREWVECILR